MTVTNNIVVMPVVTLAMRGDVPVKESEPTVTLVL